MFIGVFELFKIGIGPSSSHTMGPMLAAVEFRKVIDEYLESSPSTSVLTLNCALKGSLAFTGKGHGTDTAVLLGVHNYLPTQLGGQNITLLINKLSQTKKFETITGDNVKFSLSSNIIFDKNDTLQEHANGLVFELLNNAGDTVLTETYFSIGGGFICTKSEMNNIKLAARKESKCAYPYGFTSAKDMLKMSEKSGLSIPEMKYQNELLLTCDDELKAGLNEIWLAMKSCVEAGLTADGMLPGILNLPRRAKNLHDQLTSDPEKATMNEWLSAYAIAVNEENAAGHQVVTAPTNGAAGVIPAVLYYYVHHEKGSLEQIQNFLLVAASIAGLIKYKSSISGAEVGCQGEVGSAAAMAAAGLCAVHGGTTKQVENAAEIALEHHLGMTCDPVAGLVQIPCIERNAFGAIKAYTAAALARRGNGEHFMPLDACIEAMKQTGEEMSIKFKETSLAGLAVSVIDC